ncbi:MAG: hypothetical protein ACTHM0_13285 [Sphingomonas sp.]
MLIQACSTHPSTLSSIARTERPQLPTPDSELFRTETLPRVSGHKTGELVTIDRGELDAIAGLAGAATAAVERLNNRVTAGRELWRCTAALIATGKSATGCPTNQ